MRLFAALLIACLAACAPSPRGGSATSPPASPREVAGILVGETHLSGDVLVISDILVPRGSTLVIHPGTVLRIRPSESTKIDPEYLSPATEILVRGRLQVLGTSGRPVRFLPEKSAGGGEPAWSGLELDRSEGSALDHLEISGAETGILCIGASPVIRKVVVTGCRYGIIAQEKSAPQILDSRIENGEGGVFCWREAQPLLRGNRIAGHQEEGLFIDAGSRPRLEENEITGNGIGVALYAPDLFDPSQFRGNAEDMRRLGGEGMP